MKQLRKYIIMDWQKQRLMLEIAGRRGRAVPDDLAIRDWLHVLHRLCHLRLDPKGHPAPADTRLGLARAGVRAVFLSTLLNCRAPSGCSTRASWWR